MQEDNAPTASLSTDRVSSFERPLSPSTIVDVINAHGVRCWFARIELAGLHARRYGPFESRTDAETFLDEALEKMLELIVEDLPPLAERWTRRTELPIVEDELGAQYLAGTK